GALGDAARIGMLDDGAGGGAAGVELGDAFIGRVGVVDVVVGEVLALRLARSGDAEAGVGGAIKGGGLMRVLAIAQRLRELATDGAVGGRGIGELGGEPVGDRGGIGGGGGRGPGGGPPW